MVISSIDLMEQFAREKKEQDDKKAVEEKVK